MSDFLTTLAYGGKVAVIGMLIVFLGLILLIVILSLMAQLFKTFDKSAATETAKQAEAAPVQVVPADEALEEEVVDDTELIAVIAAAISAYEADGKKLVVRKVRRVGGWNRAARDEQISRF